MPMTKEKTAWWRGRKVAGAKHQLDWYKHAIAAYSETERAAFFAGYYGEALPVTVD